MNDKSRMRSNANSSDGPDSRGARGLLEGKISHKSDKPFRLARPLSPPPWRGRDVFRNDRFTHPSSPRVIAYHRPAARAD
ncbi:hypothetical protein J6590_103525 [Homalodisca vitripennis]|nr:hypothetical protein J6590_103525 [Homalodisca vitripennis]